MPTRDIIEFLTRINPWKFGEKKIDKVIQHLLKVTTSKEYKKYTTVSYTAY